MKKYKSAKVTGIIFAVLIFSLVVNILYLGATGKHSISGENIASFAKNRSKKEVVEYAQRGQIYTCLKFIDEGLQEGIDQFLLVYLQFSFLNLRSINIREEQLVN